MLNVSSGYPHTKADMVENLHWALFILFIPASQLLSFHALFSLSDT